ncbi:MAG: hypothetical protein COT74_13205 [Bdellovibrionales bacterium CG10_big_fil_rev_8_21_14_0_10_45_34]|nr:MAG: hypothetical protein COT74_13205 [Bdellovibrionales bacterium CG10_big_fil_rev_8_21_14_0_10_45_34]
MSDKRNFSYVVSSFYVFYPLKKETLETFRDKIESKGRSLGLVGLYLLGHEGANATYSGLLSDVLTFESYLADALKAHADSEEELKLEFKKSPSHFQPFKEFRVKVREEIVTLGREDLVPKDRKRHLSVDEFHEMLQRDDVVILDTRNDYEYEIGHFKGAIDPKIKEFRDFPEYLKASGLPKAAPTLIYCTGGIRCEKAILAMEEQGFDNVYQLEGGILKYLEKYPQGRWEGECFVFDHRLAVDAELKPTTKFKFCPHCGQPATQPITCKRCDAGAVVCTKCLEASTHKETCSRNCAYHFQRRPDKKGAPQEKSFLAQKLTEASGEAHHSG